MFILFLETKIKKACVSMLFQTYTLFQILQLALMHANQGYVGITLVCLKNACPLNCYGFEFACSN